MPRSPATSPELLDQLTDDARVKAFARDTRPAHLAQAGRCRNRQPAADARARRQVQPGRLSRSSSPQQRLTDATVRRLFEGDLARRLILAPVAANARVPVGVATPYASMLLEAAPRRAGVGPTAGVPRRARPRPTADLQTYYAQNRAALHGARAARAAHRRDRPRAGRRASPRPSSEIAAYYKANQRAYGGRETRVISQAVVPTKAAADAIAARARGGASFVAATAPAGLQRRGHQRRPADPRAIRRAGRRAGRRARPSPPPPGAIVGPIQSDLGWHVVKIDAVRGEPGSTLAAGARRNRRQADRRQAQGSAGRPRHQGRGSDRGRVEHRRSRRRQSPDADRNPADHRGRRSTAPIPPTASPPSRPRRSRPASTLERRRRSGGRDAARRRRLSARRRSGASSPPPRPRWRRSATASPPTGPPSRRPTAPAPSPPESPPRSRAACRWPTLRARPAPACRRSARSARGGSQLAQVPPQIAAPMRILFSLAAGKSRMVADAAAARAISWSARCRSPRAMPRPQPALISQVQQSFQQPASQELAEQFLAAVRKDVGVKRNEEAIAAARTRLTSSGN